MSEAKKKYGLSDKAAYYLGKAVAYDRFDRDCRKASRLPPTKAMVELLRRVDDMKGDDINLTASYISGHDTTDNALTDWMMVRKRPKF